MLVTTASLVVRNQRIWQRRESDRLLILSITVGFWRFEVDLAIQTLLLSTSFGRSWGIGGFGNVKLISPRMPVELKR